MDMKRFDEIDGLDVLERFSKEQSVYNENGHQVCIDDCKVWTIDGELSGVISLTIADILSGKWYVKKPFDVRAEMLARPNEWVGAFKNTDKKWMMLGFDTKKFNVSVRYLSNSAYYLPNDGSNGGYGVSENTLNHCIPIEDVPEEELT